MTITLDNIKQLTGLSIRGEALVGKINIKKADAKQLLVQGLSPAVTEAEIDEELDDCGGAGKAVSLGWLRSKLAGKENSKDSGIIDNCVRGYLLYLLGCVLFPNKSGDKISVTYIKFLLNLEKVKDYAWGMSGGVYLYKQLSIASHHDVRQFCGFAALIEVTWDPYRDVRASFSFDEVSFFNGCLCYLDDLAAYHPNRVLRQFGRVQGIPLKPLIPKLDTSTPRNYKIIYPNIQGHQWSQWFNHVLNETMRGTAVVDSSDYDPKYIEWYYNVSHPRVQNPIRCSGLFKRALVVARPTYDELVVPVSTRALACWPFMLTSMYIRPLVTCLGLAGCFFTAFSSLSTPILGSSGSFSLAASFASSVFRNALKAFFNSLRLLSHSYSSTPSLNSQEVSKTTSLPCPKRKASKKASHLRPHLLATIPRADLLPEVTREVVKDRLTRLFACQSLLLAKERVQLAGRFLVYQKTKSILKTLMDGGSAITQITKAYQILSIDDSSASSASKDPVDGSFASFASKDPVHDSSATSASTNPVGGPENEGCVAVVLNDGGPVNVKKRNTIGPGPGPTQGRGQGRGRGSRKK
ncbi:hypothetical protein IFM89_011126 [Coptis chinensis]|uniref:Aminotransferase-like plant mobile domain-containing protein n=1 Tax=Coptis chinensis TaxID=261450 RepID=A0A835HLP9_9MAGN|nr:hypothetical protein IFM89_011126 [Coptis chinensis]